MAKWGHNRSIYLTPDLELIVDEIRKRNKEDYPSTNQTIRVAIMLLRNLEKKLDSFPAEDREKNRMRLMRFEQ